MDYSPPQYNMNFGDFSDNTQQRKNYLQEQQHALRNLQEQRKQLEELRNNSFGSSSQPSSDFLSFDNSTSNLPSNSPTSYPPPSSSSGSSFIGNTSTTPLSSSGVKPQVSQTNFEVCILFVFMFFYCFFNLFSFCL